MNGRGCVSVGSESDLRGGDGGPVDGERRSGSGNVRIGVVSVDASLSQRDVEGFASWLAENPGAKSVAWALGHGPVDAL